MDIELKSKIDIFNDSYKEIKSAFFFDGKKMNTMKALCAVADNKNFDTDRIKEIRKWLFKSKFDLFTLRYGRFISLFLCDSEDYKKLFKISKNIYEHLTAVGFNKNKMTLAISIMLAKNFNGDKLRALVEKTAEVREKIKFSSEEHYILLALAGGDIEKIKADLNNTKKAVSSVESYRNNTSSLLALSIIIGDEDINTKVENAFSLVCNIKGEMGRIADKSFIFIGLASLIVEDPENFSKELKGVYEMLLKKNKSTFDKNRIMILSLSILIGRYIEEAQSGVTHSRVNNDYLKIIQDYVICLTYFN